MNELFYDKENKKFYVKELMIEKNGDILVSTGEKYVDVTDDMVELVQKHISKDGKQLLCIDSTTPQLPETVSYINDKATYFGYPSVIKTWEEVQLEAADEYVSKTLCDSDDGTSTALAKDAFIAGAKWQKDMLLVD